MSYLNFYVYCDTPFANKVYLGNNWFCKKNVLHVYTCVVFVCVFAYVGVTDVCAGTGVFLDFSTSAWRQDLSLNLERFVLAIQLAPGVLFLSRKQ